MTIIQELWNFCGASATKLIPDDNDIARYASRTKINPRTGRLKGSAFHLREGEEYLSVYCLDMLPGHAVSARVEHLKKDIPLDTSVNGRLGIINVGTMKEYVKSEQDKDLTVTREPVVCQDERLECNYHCGVRGIEYGNEAIAERIANCVTESYPTLKKSRFDRL